MTPEYLVAKEGELPVLLRRERDFYSVARRFKNIVELRDYMESSREKGWPEHFHYRAPTGWSPLSIDDIVALDPEGGKFLRRVKEGAVSRASRYG